MPVGRDQARRWILACAEESEATVDADAVAFATTTPAAP
jgi:hypothetical protein